MIDLQRRGVFCLLCLMIVFLIVSQAAADTCECVICHGPDGPHSGGFPSGCNICHGNPPLTNQFGVDGLVTMPSHTGATGPGAHARHAGPSGYGFTCDKCHFNGMPVTLIAESPAQLQIGFNHLGAGGGTFDGFVLQSPYIYAATNGTTVTTNGTMTCSNIYCHSNGTSVSTGVVPASTSPSWDTVGPLVCTTCHGYPPLYDQDSPKSNSHIHHTAYSCNMCHYATTNDGVTISDVTKHVNGQYDVVPGPDNNRGPGASFTYTWDRGGGTCSNIQCHGGVQHYGGINIWGGEWANLSIAATPGAACLQENFALSTLGGTLRLPYTYLWDFGDTTTSTLDAPIHTYLAPNTYTVRVDIRDADNHPSNATALVTVNSSNTLPVAGFSLAANNMTVTLTDKSSDPDYNQCGHSGPGTVHITWGDGQVTEQSINLTDIVSNQTFDHTYASTGTYTVQHFVKDNVGAQWVQSTNQQITVPPAGNTISISGTLTHSNGSAFSSRFIYLKYTNGSTYKTTATNAQGFYSFSNVPTQCYIVQPASISGYTITPTSQTVCTSNSSVNFVTTP